MEQMSIFDYIGEPENRKKTKEEIKPLIESLSLTWHHTICQYLSLIHI